VRIATARCEPREAGGNYAISRNRDTNADASVFRSVFCRVPIMLNRREFLSLSGTPSLFHHVSDPDAVVRAPTRMRDDTSTRVRSRIAERDGIAGQHLWVGCPVRSAGAGCRFLLLTGGVPAILCVQRSRIHRG
jgi:hypothetical protein